ncbi:MAG: hypothetical protein QOG38_2241 [Hyphomicrobiales bacterium]|jgi:hypothetical protein|nr:hypothetical protein [Hyphomicrobiales bacterium]
MPIAGVETTIIPNESHKSAVSWAAIAAGGIAACAFSLFLAELVAGLGLLAVSPWPGSNPSGTTLHIAGGIGLILIAVMASALGGFIAGRLRTRWVGIHVDETYFRDTAHGFLAWAFGTLLLVTALGAVGTTIMGGLTQGATQGAAQGAAMNPAVDRNAYYVDTLFRSDRPAADGNQNAGTPEASRLLARAVTPGSDLAAGDRTRLAQLVAQRTGLSQQEAQQRVDAVINQAKAAADEARKAAAKLALWMAAALLAGALAASIAAVEAGRERDAGAIVG